MNVARLLAFQPQPHAHRGARGKCLSFGFGGGWIRRTLPAIMASLVLVSLVGGPVTGSARAGLLVDPSGGTALWQTTSGSWDDQVVNRPLGFGFQFFGDLKTSVDVSTNGNLNFNGNAWYTNGSFPSSGFGMIAPLWDDLYGYWGTGQSIVEKSNPGTYYSVTWDTAQYANSSQLYRFQAIIFGQSAIVGGNIFLANDIVFSYDVVPNSSFQGDATVGVNKGDGVNFTGYTANGIVTDPSSLPVGSFIAFRANGSGYDLLTSGGVLKSTSVPEIDSAGFGSVLAVVAGALGLLERRRRNVA